MTEVSEALFGVNTIGLEEEGLEVVFGSGNPAEGGAVDESPEVLVAFSSSEADAGSVQDLCRMIAFFDT